jgi:hypothetical protein
MIEALIVIMGFVAIFMLAKAFLLVGSRSGWLNILILPLVLPAYLFAAIMSAMDDEE